jgi:hypothetical protein
MVSTVSKPCTRCGHAHTPTYSHDKVCEKCRKTALDIAYNPVGVVGSFREYEPTMVFALASNYRLRRLIYEFIKRKTPNTDFLPRLNEFFQNNWDRVVTIRNLFGLYCGRDFMELEQKYDESIAADYMTTYRLFTRTTV